ncbi:MAG: hypothetical protein H7Y00_01210, partial [Fimbriimonadaceae bacterium]|nr:hypothetical protein [Chitinophagales bacterium]
MPLQTGQYKNSPFLPARNDRKDDNKLKINCNLAVPDQGFLLKPHSMYLTGFESLLAIINSLTHTECDQVARRFELKSNHKTENRLYLLFSFIQKNVDADDERIFNLWRRKIKNDITVNAYEKAKSQLKQFILETLRFINVPGHDAYLLERLDFANILIARGLFTEAFKILQLTEKDALEFTDPLYACIINYKMIQFLPHVPEKDRPANVHELMHETGNIVGQLKIYHEIFSFNLDVAMFARQTSFIQNKKQQQQINNLLQHPVAALKINTLPYVAKCTLLKSLSWLYRIAGDAGTAHRYQKELVHVFSEKEKYNMQYRPAQYLAEWADLINISIKNNFIADANDVLKKYQDICKQYHITDAHTQLIIYNYNITIQLQANNNVIDKTIVDVQWKIINTAHQQIQTGHLLTFILTVMKGFLAIKEYKKLHDAYILILKSAPAERFDVVFAAELIYTLALYEQSHMNNSLQIVELNNHFVKQAESLYRRMH